MTVFGDLKINYYTEHIYFFVIILREIKQMKVRLIFKMKTCFYLPLPLFQALQTNIEIVLFVHNMIMSTCVDTYKYEFNSL